MPSRQPAPIAGDFAPVLVLPPERMNVLWAGVQVPGRAGDQADEDRPGLAQARARRRRRARSKGEPARSSEGKTSQRLRGPEGPGRRGCRRHARPHRQPQGTDPESRQDSARRVQRRALQGSADLVSAPCPGHKERRGVTTSPEERQTPAPRRSVPGEGPPLRPGGRPAPPALKP